MTSKTTSDLMSYEVPEDLMLKVVALSDEEVVRTFFVNALPAAIAGKESFFWRLQAAVMQEMKRRSLKAGDMLS